MDVLAFKYKTSIFKNFNPQFWKASVSWRNKYKNGNKELGPKFFGSTTFLVFITDAWHLFQFFCNSFIILGIIFSIHYMFRQNVLVYCMLFLILKIIWGSVFELFYSKLFRIKK